MSEEKVRLDGIGGASRLQSISGSSKLDSLAHRRLRIDVDGKKYVKVSYFGCLFKVNFI